MRRAFVLLLLVLAAAACLAWLVQLDAGYVLIEFRGTTIEMTVWVGLLLALAALVAFYYAARALVLLADALAALGPRPAGPKPGLLPSWRERHRSHTARGALAFVSGRWREAGRDLARGAKKADAPVLNYLLAARASAAGGDAQLADGFLQLAAETAGSAEAVAIARAEIRLAAGDAAAALALVDAAKIDGAKHPAALRLQVQALRERGEWARLAALLPEAARSGAITEAERDAAGERAFLALLAIPGLGADDARKTWDALPTALRERPALLAAFAARLPGDDAAKLLARALERNWHPDLIRQYALCAVREPARQLAFAEGLLAAHPRDAELLLALGRIALRNRLWGKARDWLERCLAVQQRADACAELARLCDRLGEPERARALLARAVAASVGELPQLPLPESRSAPARNYS